MTNISIEDVQHLAQLSSLQVDDTEAESLRVELGNILDNIEQLSELNTEGVEPTYQVTDLKNVWREDTVDDYGIGRDELIALAPDADRQQIKVPKVL